MTIMDVDTAPGAAATEFEPLDILNFPSNDAALLEKDLNTGPEPGGMDMDIDAEFEIMESKTASTTMGQAQTGHVMAGREGGERNGSGSGSKGEHEGRPKTNMSMMSMMGIEEPPPDDEYEEEPDWEEEVSIAEVRVVTQRFQSQHATASSRPTSQVAGPQDSRRDVQVHSTSGVDKGKEKGSIGAEESMSFGASDLLDNAVATSSRTTLDAAGPLESRDLDTSLPPSLYYGTLRAETASGKVISFQRRGRPKPRPIRGQSTNGNGESSVGHLLGQPLHHLLADVQELKSRERALKLQREFDEEARVTAMRNGGGMRDTTASKDTAGSMSMWVDKYRPKRFSDLLGDDRVHRDVLGWLKEWDKCVFKRPNPVKKRRLDTVDAEVSNPYTDPLDRPKDRILLLSGPPGLGKTTLAHIVARQAGYKTLEINASDDRSAATVSTRIKNAIESGTGLASEGRPTCVVIDEVDGASGGGDASFIRSLIKLIQDVPARRRGGTRTPAKPLRRPIICICNDLYANSLRPLRPFARIVRFKQPQSQLLVKRLRTICDSESLQADLRVLTTLVEMTTGDVRSCLNTLQFIKSKSSTVTSEAIKSSSVGLKDSGTTLQTVWNNLFIPLAAKVRRKQLASIDDGRFVNRLVDDVQSCGEYDKIVQGLWEHYPNLKPLDASLVNVTRLHDWVRYYDSISQKVNERQEFELMGYLPYAVVPWYSHMAAPANSSKPTEWPRADYESYQTRVVNEEIVTGLKKTLPGIIRSLFPTSTLLTELIPLLMRIITPPLRPVNANIVKPGEKATLNRLVEIMIPLGLTFWQEKAENGQPMMRLEPPIDVFVHYEGKRADDIAASRFAVRQLVAQAMDAEIARRKGGVTEGTSGAESLKDMYGVVKRGGVDPKLKTETIATDFFGRKIVVKAAREPLAKESAPTGSEDVYTESVRSLLPAAKRFRAMYKFNEGSSSAVRKNVKMSELM